MKMKALRLSLVFIVICGLIYPLAATGVAQVIFPNKANGSLIEKNGEVVGSKWIGQNFASNKYFHGRVSSIANNASASGSENLAPSNPELKKRVENSIATLQKENPTMSSSNIPADLVTNSGSGLDPDISVASAKLQVDRVAKANQLDTKIVSELVSDNTTNRSLGIFGEPRVNVLQLNLALNELID
ncbi:potassium-transporting ATPase subunit KdpC [Listeria booriae]|uniref:Potassium-transporting ATPase KdpC subunit n=2 Tax=Listeria booriae TaxID=1552123 RepID=A0A099W8K6_9LIST|nr:potassium-transporting ATPase subunit C [Listeria booriae]MBC1330681.1 potassium-transporting ATPase subunit KdpC [Listeria booriae]MBC1334114.1 potassium-transporting ATPase subunit KdpC [Listeria booriae]MBC1400468.1 potassium-transporting ATPase subunit KdpC [Listeria booriae]MBC1490407.1 potassium-transporting ATPase subunit KdpC [Listeria booriae]